jgi:phosphoribosylformylglycinamidine cyclo-ligase
MIGLQSTGLHSNGYTLARRVLLEEEGLALDAVLESTRRPLVDDLLAPTHIYVPEWRALDRAHVSMHAILNITGDGLFNIVRVDAPVGFVIDHLPIPQPIFTEIATRGQIPPEEMYKTFNMGIGFCFVVPEDEVSDAMRVLRSFPRPAFVMGRVVDDPEKKITIPGLDLVGKDDQFHRV